MKDVVSADARGRPAASSGNGVVYPAYRPRA